MNEIPDNTHSIPSFEDFLKFSPEQLAELMPETILLAPGGTRRKAAMSGIKQSEDEYAASAQREMHGLIDMFFEFGAQHLVISVLTPSMLAEIGKYREKLILWINELVGGDEAIKVYKERNWRVRLVGTETVPQLQNCTAKLIEETTNDSDKTVWLTVCGDIEAQMDYLLSLSQKTGSSSFNELISTYYGENVPKAGIFLSWMKPTISYDIISPLLIGTPTAGYWTQFPGFEQNREVMLRMIYDYAYTRKTWMEDKSLRYTDVKEEEWDQGLILGIGEERDKNSPFWRPLQGSVLEES